MLLDPDELALPVPLFPLPNLVLFPGVVQPLHIFEERYKQMTVAALADRRLIAMALLKPGWEEHYYGRPAIHATVCLGRIVAHETVEQGKYNLLLQGLARAVVDSETREGMYRVAQLTLMAEGEADPQRDPVHRTILTELFEGGALAGLPIASAICDLLKEGAATGAIVDVAAFALVQDVAAKQRLLEETDPTRRAEEVIMYLGKLGRAGETKDPGTEGRDENRRGDSMRGENMRGGWPPPLSEN